MRRADLPAPRARPLPAVARWHATLRYAYLRLAEKHAPEYPSIQCRMHWKAWSHCR
jgi:hypothetical protein